MANKAFIKSNFKLIWDLVELECLQMLLPCMYSYMSFPMYLHVKVYMAALPLPVGPSALWATPAAAGVTTANSG